MCVKRITIVGKLLHISSGKLLHIFKLSANVPCSSLPAVGRAGFKVQGLNQLPAVSQTREAGMLGRGVARQHSAISKAEEGQESEYRASMSYSTHPTP